MELGGDGWSWVEVGARFSNTLFAVHIILFEQKISSQTPQKNPTTQVLSCEFCEIPKNTFFPEHLQTTAFTSDIIHCSDSYQIRELESEHDS